MGRLASLEGFEWRSLDSFVARILQVATVVPTTLAVFRAATRYATDFGLTLPDAIVLASTVEHAKTRPPAESKVFANRNPKDFDVRDVIALLAEHGCELAVTFEKAWNRLERR